MSLNKFTDAQKGLDLKLEIGCKKLVVDGEELKVDYPKINTALVGSISASLPPVLLDTTGVFKRVSYQAITESLPIGVSPLVDVGTSGIIWEIPSMLVKVHGHIEFISSSPIPLVLKFDVGSNIGDLTPVNVYIKNDMAVSSADIESIFLVGSAPDADTSIALKLATSMIGSTNITITNWTLSMQYVSEFTI
jgi:hypothetical protein